MEFKEYGVITVEQLVNEGIGDVAMKSVAATRPKIFGVDTYVIGNVVGGLLIGLAAPKLMKLEGDKKLAAEIVGAGLLAKGIVQLAKTFTAPATGMGMGVIRAAPSQTLPTTIVGAPSIF